MMSSTLAHGCGKTSVRHGRSLAAAIALSLVGSGLTACAKQPMRIVASSGRANDISFLVTMHEGDQLTSYVISCARAADGALSACRQLPVVLEGD